MGCTSVILFILAWLVWLDTCRWCIFCIFLAHHVVWFSLGSCFICIYVICQSESLQCSCYGFMFSNDRIHMYLQCIYFNFAHLFLMNKVIQQSFRFYTTEHFFYVMKKGSLVILGLLPPPDYNVSMKHCLQKNKKIRKMCWSNKELQRTQRELPTFHLWLFKRPNKILFIC